MLSGWCVPCGGGGIRPAGDDPSSGDTMCAFPDKAALKAAVDACLSAVPSGEACCSTDANCADPSSARCGSAGCVDMPDWDVSLVTDMQFLFGGARNFNGDLSRWDVGSVRNMRDMFLTARKFAGGDLSSWNTSKVTDMRGMFACGDPSPSTNVFNGDVSTWDVSSVTGMTNMFLRAGAFNQDISSWNTSQVTDMRYMFKESRRLLPGHHRVDHHLADHLHRDVYRRHRVARSSPARRRNRNLPARSASGSISRAW